MLPDQVIGFMLLFFWGGRGEFFFCPMYKFGVVFLFCFGVVGGGVGWGGGVFFCATWKNVDLVICFPVFVLWCSALLLGIGQLNYYFIEDQHIVKLYFTKFSLD